MKLHDLQPAPGSRKARMRVGRGIAAGKGKTAGRGTKGQKARARWHIPAWFEGGQTPIHIRVPKLHGFKRPWRIDYQVVNVGRISDYAEAGRFGVPSPDKSPLTVNPEMLRAAGLITTSASRSRCSARATSPSSCSCRRCVHRQRAQKIEAAGGFVQLLAATEPAAPSP